MAQNYDVQLQTLLNGGVVPKVGVWIQLVNNDTGTAYVSTGITDGTGKATFSPKPPGDTYVVNISTVSSSGPWVSFNVNNWAVPVIQGENISMQSITGQVTGPYTPSAPAGGEALGSGDNAQFLAAFGVGVTTQGSVSRITLGTAATPDTSPNPAIKITRTGKILVGQVYGDGADQVNALSAGYVNDVASSAQGTGVFGWARTKSTITGADANGGYFAGVATDTSVCGGVGIFANGVALASGSHAQGAGINVQNSTGSDHSTNPTSIGLTQGVYISSTGLNRSAAAIEIQAGATTARFATGIHFVGGATNNGTIVNDYLSDSSAATSLQINGTHATAAISVGNGAGATILGTDPGGGENLRVAGSARIQGVSYGLLAIAPSGTGQVRLDTTAAAAQATIYYMDAGTTKWQVGKDGGNNWFMFNAVTTHNPLTIASATDIVTLGFGLIVSAGGIRTTGDPGGAASSFGITNSTGIGNAANANIQAPGFGTGSGPATPGLVAQWLKVYDGTTTRWVPMMV